MYVNLASKGKEYLEQRKAMKNHEANEEMPVQEEVTEVKEVVEVATNCHVCSLMGNMVRNDSFPT